jgi:hypothetical protein
MSFLGTYFESTEDLQAFLWKNTGLTTLHIVDSSGLESLPELSDSLIMFPAGKCVRIAG